MADVPDPEPARYARYRASLRRPWRRSPDAQTGLEQLRALRDETAEGGRFGRWRRRRRLRVPRPRWLRALRWTGIALAGWIAVSLVLFVVS